MKKPFSINMIEPPESPESSNSIEAEVFPPSSPFADCTAIQCQLGQLPDAELSRVQLRECTGTGRQWRGARLRDFEINRCEISNADWSEGSIARGVISSSKAVGWQVSGTRFEHCVFRQCKLSMLRSIEGQWRRCWFEDCDLKDAEFEGSSFEEVVFRGCNLQGARFVRTHLGTVDFRGSDVEGIVVSPESAPGALITPEQADVFAAALGLRVQSLPFE